MYRKILTVLLVMVLFVNLPLTALALETTGTETMAATEAAGTAAELSMQPQTGLEPPQSPSQPAEAEPTTASEPPVQPSEPSQSTEPSHRQSHRSQPRQLLRPLFPLFWKLTRSISIPGWTKLMRMAIPPGSAGIPCTYLSRC